MPNRKLLVLIVATVAVSSAAADHHHSLEFLKSFEGVWDATEGKEVRGTSTFIFGVSGQSLYIQGDMGKNKFEDFITYDPKSKTWLIVGVGNDGSRYTHSVKKFPQGRMKAGQTWTAETKGVTATGEPTSGSLYFVAKSPDRYEMTIKETIDGDAQPDRLLVVERRTEE